MDGGGAERGGRVGLAVEHHGEVLALSWSTLEAPQRDQFWMGKIR